MRAADARPEPYPRETPHDPEGRLVEVAYGPARGPVHVVIDGALTSPVVAFVHGIPGTVRDARYLGPALARRGLCCVRIDMPGFGRTPRATMPEPHATARADVVAAVMQALGVQRFAVAVHSIAGAVGLAVAARHAAHVDALVLINAVGVTRHRGLVVPTSVHVLMHRLATTPLGPLMAQNLDRYYEARGLRGERPLDADTFAHHVSIVAALDFVEQRRHAHAVSVPTLLFSTDDDALVEPAVTRALRDALTHAPRVAHLHTPVGGHHGQKIAAAPIADWCAAELVGAA